MSSPSFQLTRNFADRLPAYSVSCEPMVVQCPRLLQFNSELAQELGMPIDDDADRLARIFAGQEMMQGAYPVAQAYAGHQFGGFSPQLGDGRALLLGEIVDRDGHCRDIALKGSGPTPFSRRGDGKAAIGPVLREYLIGEAMHALGIPTTRALAAVSTGETIMRMQPLPGAILTRVAASHLRVGSFEYFAARQRFDHVAELAEFALERHYPELAEKGNRYLRMLRAVANRQAELVAQWMLIGFIHGVMNTDNMTISGETIDYGPCAFMDAYQTHRRLQLDRYAGTICVLQSAADRSLESGPFCRDASAVDGPRRATTSGGSGNRSDRQVRSSLRGTLHGWVAKQAGVERQT